jgi:hypothetical protein
LAYCAAGKKPPDIPASPETVYRTVGWVGMGDWLGTGKIARGQYQSFTDARDFVRKLKFKSSREWKKYCQTGEKPANIPFAPQIVYAKAGWAGMNDWLGTGKVAPGRYRPFEEARAFVRTLNLKKSDEWVDYCRSGNRPADIPSNPDKAYSEVGWMGYADWLGNGKVARGQFRPFNEARSYVRGLNLKTNIEWRSYLKSGDKPGDIPAGPSLVYASDGWSGWGDWLGTGAVAPRSRRSGRRSEAWSKKGTGDAPAPADASA